MSLASLKKNLSPSIEPPSFHRPLVQRIRTKSLKSWLASRFLKAELKDIADKGADGFAGFICKSDISKLYTSFTEEIWKTVASEAEELGMETPLELINEIMARENNKIKDLTTFEKTMLTTAAESIAAKLITEIDRLN